MLRLKLKGYWEKVTLRYIRGRVDQRLDPEVCVVERRNLPAMWHHRMPYLPIRGYTTSEARVSPYTHKDLFTFTPILMHPPLGCTSSPHHAWTSSHSFITAANGLNDGNRQPDRVYKKKIEPLSNRLISFGSYTIWLVAKDPKRRWETEGIEQGSTHSLSS